MPGTDATKERGTAFQTKEQPTDLFRRFELENGVRVCILHAKDAPRQSTFTLLPLGLALDGPGRAQYSHLVEHCLIRAVDPEGFELDGARINGETMASSLRLETLAEAGRWRESIERQARWLATAEFDEATLEREKGRVAGEVDATVAGGLTHKWAEAAWAQAVLHGREHAAVLGDVQSASIAAVREYSRERVALGNGVVIVSAGPVDPADLLELVRKELDRKSPPRAAIASVDFERAWKPGDRKATWDLDARHYVEWYELQSASVRERVEAAVLSRAVQIQLSQETRSLSKGAQALASVLRLAPEERGLLISICVPADVELDLLRKCVRNALDAVVGSASTLSLASFSLASEIGSLPDFAALRNQLGSSPGAEFIEAQAALNLANLEFQCDSTVPEIATRLRELDARALARSCAGSLASAKRCSLLLEARE